MRKEELSAEYQWKEFLRLGKVKEEDMPEVQRRETKKAFYAAISQLLTVFREGVALIEDEQEAVEVMNKIHSEVEAFWEQQVIEHAEYVKRAEQEKGRVTFN